MVYECYLDVYNNWPNTGALDDMYLLKKLILLFEIQGELYKI